MGTKTIWDLEEDTAYNMVGPTGALIEKNVTFDGTGVLNSRNIAIKVPGSARFVEAEAGYDDDETTPVVGLDVNTAYSLRELKKDSIYRTKAGNFFAATSNGLYNFDEKKWVISRPVERSYGSEKRFKYVGPLGISQTEAIRRAG